MILLDSDVLIDLLRNYLPAARWFAALPEDEDLVVSGFVVAELQAALQAIGANLGEERIRRQREAGQPLHTRRDHPLARGQPLELILERLHSGKPRRGRGDLVRRLVAVGAQEQGEIPAPLGLPAI